jgi:predicted  nucleic acid-binding Zn ribbon protein
MNSPKSQLSQLGIWICRELEKVCDKPVYYFLFQMNDSHRSRKMCPICGEDWTLPEKINGVAFKCAPCRLISCEA